MMPRPIKSEPTVFESALGTLPVCPRCGSDAVNRYGRISSGKQRFLCLVCGRQFVEDKPHRVIAHRPRCPKCGATMHVYVRRGNVIRFRCAGYPACRTFVKWTAS